MCHHTVEIYGEKPDG